MKEYLVRVPINGYITVSVNADNEDEAIDMAFDSYDLTLNNIDEWEAFEHIVNGNVFCGICNDVYVEETK